MPDPQRLALTKDLPGLLELGIVQRTVGRGWGEDGGGGEEEGRVEEGSRVFGSPATG